MKRLLKILVPVFIISLAFSLFFIPASAAKQESGYAVWSSEADYLANPSRPITRVEAKKLDPALLASGGFVFCYGDVEVTQDIAMGVGFHLVIDLDGHSMYASKKIQVNNPFSTSWREPGSLTIRNGTIEHLTNQFIQSRANSEVYLENLVINALQGNYAFVYESGTRIIHFKNCEINFSQTAVGSLVYTEPAFSAEKADQMYGDIDYVRNIVFENTVINDETPENNGSYPVTVISRNDKDKYDILNVSFTGTSSFNILRDNFIYDANTFETSKITVNIGTGVRFPTKEIPITAKGFKVNYYDSIAVKGNRVEFGNKTELLSPGEQQPTEGPKKLIWGKSARWTEEYEEYQLCTYLAGVTWVMPGGEEINGFDDYAGGVILEKDVGISAPYSFTDDGRVKRETHDGWSLSEDGSNPTKSVTLTGETNKFYAVTTESILSVVEFTSSEMILENIVGGIVGNEITSKDFDSFEEGAYVRFYEDMVWTTDDAYLFDKTLTLDLGGKTFVKDLVMSHGSGCFSVEGGSLTVKDGSVSSSLTSFATVTGGAVTLDGVTLTFDAYPAFNVSSGSVTVKYSCIEQRSNDTDIPAFSISSHDNVSVDVTASEFVLSGPFAVLSAKNGELGSTEISIKSCNDSICPEKVCTSKVCATEECTDVNCTHKLCDGGESCTHEKKCVHDNCNITAYSLISVYEYSADAIPAGAQVNVDLDAVLLTSREVFDIGTRYNGVPALDVIADIDDECYFTAKPEVLSGELILPEEMTVLGFNAPGNSFRYRIATLELPSVMFNLALEEGFTANFYVPCESTLSAASTYLGSISVSELPVTAIDGVAYYVVSVFGINPTSVLDAINIKLSYLSSTGATDGGKVEYTAELEYFVTEYFDRLLSDRDPLVKKLVASAINYVASVYEYKECELTDEFAAFLTDDRYLDVLRPTDELPKIVSKTDIGNLSVAFTGAQLYLSSDLSLRFNLRDSFSGTLYIDGNYYTVTNGRVGDASYVQIGIEAQDFYGEIVTVSGTSLDGTLIAGTYSLIDYVNAHSAGDPALRDFVLAFYCYCYEANVYKNEGVVPPVNDHTPPLDVELR